MFLITRKTEDGKPISYSCNIGCVEWYSPHFFPKKEYWLCIGVGWDPEKQDYIYYGITTEKRKLLHTVTPQNSIHIYLIDNIDRDFYYYGPNHLVKFSDLPKKHDALGRITTLGPVYEMMEKYKYHMHFKNPKFMNGLIYKISDEPLKYFMPVETFAKCDTAKGLIIDTEQKYEVYKGSAPLSLLTEENVNSRLSWDSYQTLLGVYRNDICCMAENKIFEAELLC